jgi:putative DNA primase/helicase
MKLCTNEDAGDAGAYERLAGLSRDEYDRCRKAEARRLGVRVETLDAEVHARRRRASPARLGEVEPWPQPVEGVAVLMEVRETFHCYAVLPAGAAEALALWCAHAHACRAFLCTPRLNLSSVEKRCGKTTLRDVIATLTPRPVLTENLSLAVLFRLVEAQAPTILADECDGWLRTNEELRGLLNAGHRREGRAFRCGRGDLEVRAYGVFAPAVLCGIGALPGTLQDRSIVIRLERAKPGELRERFDSRRTERERELGRKLARWCADHFAELEGRDPALPAGAFNRLADNWRPLFAVAEVAGGEWPGLAVEAFSRLREDEEDESLNVRLLADIRRVFRETGAERLASSELCGWLAELEGSPWAEYGPGRGPVTVYQVAEALKAFRILPQTLRLAPGDIRKGYCVGDFTEAFERYLKRE